MEKRPYLTQEQVKDMVQATFVSEKERGRKGKVGGSFSPPKNRHSYMTMCL
jgi:hypothetical protein